MITLSEKEIALDAVRKGQDSGAMVMALSKESFDMAQRSIYHRIDAGIANIHSVVGSYGEGKTTIARELSRMYWERGAISSTVRISAERSENARNFLVRLFLLNGNLPKYLQEINKASPLDTSSALSPQVRSIIDIALHIDLSTEEHEFNTAALNYLSEAGVLAMQRFAKKYQVPLVGRFDRRISGDKLLPSLARVLDSAKVRFAVIVDEADAIDKFRVSALAEMLEVFRATYDDAQKFNFDFFLFFTPSSVEELSTYPALLERLIFNEALPTFEGVQWTTGMFRPTNKSYLSMLLEWSEAVYARHRRIPALSLCHFPIEADAIAGGDNLRTVGKRFMSLIDLYYQGGFDEFEKAVACYCPDTASTEIDSADLEMYPPLPPQKKNSSGVREMLNDIVLLLSEDDGQVSNSRNTNPLTKSIPEEGGSDRRDDERCGAVSSKRETFYHHLYGEVSNKHGDASSMRFFELLEGYYPRGRVEKNRMHRKFVSCMSSFRLAMLIAKCRDQGLSVTLDRDGGSNIRRDQFGKPYQVSEVREHGRGLSIFLPNNMYADQVTRVKLADIIAHEIIACHPYLAKARRLERGFSLIRFAVYGLMLNSQLISSELEIDEMTQYILRTCAHYLTADQNVSRSGVFVKKKGFFGIKSVQISPLIVIAGT